MKHSSLKTFSCCSVACLTFLCAPIDAAEAQAEPLEESTVQVATRDAVKQATQTSFLTQFNSLFNFDSFSEWCEQYACKPSPLSVEDQAQEEHADARDSQQIKSEEKPQKENSELASKQSQAPCEQASEENHKITCDQTEKQCTVDACDSNQVSAKQAHNDIMNTLDEIGKKYLGDLQTIIKNDEAKGDSSQSITQN